MAQIFNGRRVRGVRVLNEGATLFNMMPVRGVRVAADGVLFDGGQQTIGVDVLDQDRAIWNEQLVMGVVVITDDRPLYNGMEILPASALTGSLGGNIPPSAPLASVDYFARDGATYPWYNATTPNAVYDATSNTTWIAYERWDGQERRIALRVYDHATDLWSQTYDLFRSPIPDNDHGVPSLCFDSQGHVHVFGGAHASQVLWWSTTAPRDPASFVQRGLIGTDSGDGYSYPHPIVHGDTIFLFMRDSSGTGMPLVLRRITGISNGAGTIGSETTISQLANTRNYIGWIVRTGNQVIIPIYGSSMDDSQRRNVWLLAYDLTTGAVSNIAGTVTTPQASLPITLGANHVVVDQIAAGKFGGFGFVEYDTAGRLHLVYQEGDSAAGTRTMHHMIYTGGAWSAPVLVGTLGNVYNGIALKSLSDGSMMLLYAQSDASVRDGSIQRRDWTAAGGWSAEALVMPSGDYTLGVPNPVLNGGDQFAMVFAETSPPGSGGATLNSDVSGILKAYAYGTAGFVQAQGVVTAITNARVVGTPVVGRVLSVQADIAGEPQPDLTYQWRRNGGNINGATAATYTAVSDDIEAVITCEVAADGLNGTATAIAEGVTVQADLSGISIAQIAGPALLFNVDASKAGSLTLSGGDVTGWQDQSAAAFAMTVAPSSTAPEYSATGWDGTRPAVIFNGAVSGDMLRAGGPLNSYSTTYIVAERIAGTNNDGSYGGLRPMMALQMAPAEGSTARVSQKVMPSIIRSGADSAQSTYQLTVPGGGSQVVTSGFTVGTKTILRNRIRPTPGVLLGAKVGNAAEVLGSDSNTGTFETIGNNFFLGGDSQNVGRRAAFKLAELVVFYGNPTAQQDADIRATLSAKWGIALP